MAETARRRSSRKAASESAWASTWASARTVARVLAVFAALVLAAGTGTGCSTILLVRNPQTRMFTDPVYESSKPFFFFGLVGPDYEVYVDQVCLGKDADQVSTEYTVGNTLTSLLTLGIYTPRTVKIWCEL